MNRLFVSLSTALVVALMFAPGCVEPEPDEASVEHSPLERGVLPASTDSKSDTVQVAPGFYVSGVPPRRLELLAMPGTWGRQNMSNWCWAAVLQSILRFHGVSITQEDIVHRAYGGFIDRPANDAEITNTVNNWAFVDSAGLAWMLNAQPQSEVTVTSVLEDLHFNQPVLVGLSGPPGETGAVGHAYVLSAISYRLDANGFVFPQDVQLRDPWPDNPSEIEMPWSEFMQRHLFYIRVRATLL